MLGEKTERGCKDDWLLLFKQNKTKRKLLGAGIHEHSLNEMKTHENKMFFSIEHKNYHAPEKEKRGGKSLDLKTKQDTCPAVPLGFGQMPRNHTCLVCQVHRICK